MMTNHDGWREQVQGAADRAGEAVWPLPLPTEYRKLLDSEVADLRNISTGGYGGALTAAIFLEQFVDDRPWVHLDIAGPARAGSDDGYLVKGGTGFGVRTLLELVDAFSVPEGDVKGTNGAATTTNGKRPARATKQAAARKPTAKATTKRTTTKRTPSKRSPRNR